MWLNHKNRWMTQISRALVGRPTRPTSNLPSTVNSRVNFTVNSSPWQPGRAVVRAGHSRRLFDCQALAGVTPWQVDSSFQTPVDTSVYRLKMQNQPPQ